MHHFAYKAGQLYVEGTPVSRIAAQCPTPFYVYATATLCRHYHVLKDAFSPRPVDIRFAAKANSNASVLATLAGIGSGADVVSGGEIGICLRAGIPPDRIAFSGVGKTTDELSLALNAGIGQINVESEPELDRLVELAIQRRQIAPVALRLNPNVRAGGNDKISTGTRSAKFGLPASAILPLYERINAHPNLAPRGLACHIGSQISELAPLERAFKALRDLAMTLQGLGMRVPNLDIGGGLAVPYAEDGNHASPRDYGAMAKAVFSDYTGTLILEPGRLIAANAGALIASVLYTLQRDGRNFLVLDAAMNDLIRPSLYAARHAVIPERQPATTGSPTDTYDIVGPICESGDTFARQHSMPRCAPGERVAILSSGAYGAVMASTYNSRPLIGEVIVNDEAFCITRARQTHANLVERDEIAPWLRADVPSEDSVVPARRPDPNSPP